MTHIFSLLPQATVRFLLAVAASCALLSAAARAHGQETTTFGPHFPLPVRQHNDSAHAVHPQTIAETIIILSCAVLVGSCVGSFLNVVVYRLPNQMGLLRADSHCPVCQMPIAAKDNIPVLGWLKLKGRCRECSVRISPRYPIVEAVTGLLFVGLAWFELVGGGRNLPWQPAGEFQELELFAANFLPIFFYHSFLLCTLLSAVLISADGHAIPRSLAVPAFAVGLLGPVFSGGMLRPDWMTFTAASSGVNELVVGLAGAAIGSVLGMVLSMAEPKPTPVKKRLASVFVLALAGCYLGKVVVAIAGLAAILLLTATLVGTRSIFVRRIPVVGFAAAAVLSQVFFWNTLDNLPFWPEFSGDVFSDVRRVGVLVLFLLSAVLVHRVLHAFSLNTSQRIEGSAT